VDQPTLEELRQVTKPAWLWDPSRHRIVWANDAGLAFFEAESLFDLLDRPFDPREPGVGRIAELSGQLRHGEVKSALLGFPSAGAAAPLPCLCFVHTLPDGRQGVLVAADAEPGGVAAETKAEMLDALPLAVLLAEADGAISYVNPAAAALFPAAPGGSLAGLFGSETADLLQKRLAAAKTLGFTRRVSTRYGVRDIRLTALLEPGGRTMLALDDVTDRRALERTLSPQAPQQRLETPAETAVVQAPPRAPARPREEPKEPRLTSVERAAFREIGETLNDEAARKPKTSVPAIPPLLLATIDKLAGTNVFLKDGAILYANAAALKLLRHDTLESLIGSETANALATNVAAREPVSLPLGDTSMARLRLTTDTIPWLSGPALRVDLAPAPQAEGRVIPLPTQAPAPAPKDAGPAAEEPPASGPYNFPKLELIPRRPRQSQEEARREPPPVELPPERPSREAPAVRPTGETAIAAPPAEPPALSRKADANDDGELRAVLDTVTDGIITLDDDGNIRRLSAGAEAIFGRRLAEVADKPLASLLAPESRKVLRDYLAALKGPGLAAVFNDGREVTAIEKGGGRVPLFLTIGKLDPARAGGARFSAVVRDITQWKKTEEELREARDRAERASRQKSEFLAKVSHELRTPLNAILGFSEVMRLERFGEIRNDKYRGYVNDIHMSGSHLLSLIDDLLDLSKVEAGKLELNFTAVPLGEVADHGIKLVQDHAAQARVIIRKNIPPGLPKVVADQRSMRQIALNLLSNAVKYTDPGGQVIVSAEMTPQGELVFRVKDSGIGMSGEEIKDALEPFRRVSVDGREAPGTGLGLPLTKALAEANRARFAIVSEPRKGTTVEVTFPVTRVLAE
jgi:PAS domain S-box-containing protein